MQACVTPGNQFEEMCTVPTSTVPILLRLSWQRQSRRYAVIAEMPKFTAKEKWGVGGTGDEMDELHNGG